MPTRQGIFGIVHGTFVNVQISTLKATLKTLLFRVLKVGFLRTQISFPGIVYLCRKPLPGGVSLEEVSIYRPTGKESG